MIRHSTLDEMFPLLCAILLFSVGLALLGAEFFIPAQGVTAGLGLLALLAGVIACFFVGEWVGLSALGTGAILAPIGAAGWMRIFPRTWIGRRVVLPPAPKPAGMVASRVAPVRVGQAGVAISAMRPSGVCEFDDLRGDAGPADKLRVQAISDFGDIAPGSRVRVICFADGRATVRLAE
jgi:membrane-bound serine protease (ClpP class)